MLRCNKAFWLATASHVIIINQSAISALLSYSKICLWQLSPVLLDWILLNNKICCYFLCSKATETSQTGD